MLSRNSMILLSLLSASVISVEVHSDSGVKYGAGHKFEITVTNITKSNAFSRIVAYSHEKGYRVYKEGRAATAGLAAMSQSGVRFVEFVNELVATKGILDISVADNILTNGRTVTVAVDADRHHNHFSMAAMVAPTNDSFIAVNGIEGPRRLNAIRTYYLQALDSGSEANTELCDRGVTLDHQDPNSIPMPIALCIGSSSGLPVTEMPALALVEEGYVHNHPGIKGIGDLHPAIYDWRNPVAKVTVRRVR